MTASPAGTRSFMVLLAVFLAYSALAVAVTWPLTRDLGGTVLPDLGDPLLNTWILWWNATNVPLSTTWWDAPAFFPARGVLAFSEHLLGLSPIASPVFWTTGSPLAAYNVTLLATFALSGTAAYLLGLELTGRRDAAFICGLAFGFAPYRFAHLSHVQVLASFWMPVALLGLHRYLRDRRARHLLLFSVAWLMQALSNGYYLFFFPVLVVLWCVWFVRIRDWKMGLGIAFAGAAPAIVLAPILLTYREIHAHYGLTRDLDVTLSYSADAASWLSAAPWLWWWGGLRVYGRPEGELFTGIVVILLTMLPLVLVGRARRVAAGRAQWSVLGFYACAAVAMYLFALGPEPTLMGEPFLPAGPYRLLMSLPGFEALRVPARFGMLVALCLAVAAAVGYAVVSAAWSGRWRLLVAGFAAAAITAESWTRPLPMLPPPVSLDVRPQDLTGGLLVLPMLSHGQHEVALMYQAMSHGRPLVNGYSGHLSPWYFRLRDRLDALDPAVLDALAEAGVTQIAVVHRHDRGGDWRNYALTRSSLARTGAEVSLFNLHSPQPSAPAGPPVPIRSIDVSEHPALVASMTDGDLTTFWHSRQPQEGGERVLVDLGDARRVAAIETSIGRFEDAYPRELAIEVSVDGKSWSNVWQGRGEERVTAAMFQAPQPMWLRFPLGTREARYLRLTQIGRANTSSWTIAELVVRAPAR